MKNRLSPVIKINNMLRVYTAQRLTARIRKNCQNGRVSGRTHFAQVVQDLGLSPFSVLSADIPRNE